MYGLNEAGLLDEFWHFLEEVGVFALVEQIKATTIRRVMVPVVMMVSLYFLKTLYGIESMNALPALLFSNVAAMTLLGFNAHQIANGFSRRGDHRRQKKPKQGPLTPQALAANMAKLGETTVLTFFNGCIAALAALGVFASELIVAVDGSRIETTEKYAGRGCLKVERRKRSPEGTWVTVVDWVYGWKVVVLMDTRTRIPLALKVLKIEAYEGEWLVPLVKQAQANLGTHARIVTVAADRGYLDGVDLYELEEMGIVWVMWTKQGMAVRTEAIARSAEEAEQRRVTQVRRGQGRNQREEEEVTVLVGVSGLKAYTQYGPPRQEGERRSYDQRPGLNGVVVRQWKNHVYETPPVLLTNGSVEDAFVAYDDYDRRSLIENGIFREGKQPWNLEHAPMKTEAAVIVHITFTLAVMALATAFRLWSKQQELAQEEPAQQDAAAPDFTLLEGEGTQAWRRRLQQENRDKVIVFVDQHFGIFHTAEFSILAGLHIKPAGIPAELGTAADILRRYGIPECT
ncbi:MAG: transposase [Halothiobacillaceae bacterium]